MKAWLPVVGDTSEHSVPPEPPVGQAEFFRSGAAMSAVPLLDFISFPSPSLGGLPLQELASNFQVCFCGI